MKKKIFIILPHKDQFTKKYAGSASIWVKDFFKKTKFKKDIKIFGSIDTDDVNSVYIKKNYFNIQIPKKKRKLLAFWILGL